MCVQLFALSSWVGPRFFFFWGGRGGGGVISLVNKQFYKTKEISSLGPEKLVCYIRYSVISDLFILSFHCISSSLKY